MQQRTNPDRIDRDREDGFAVLVIDPFDDEQGKSAVARSRKPNQPKIIRVVGEESVPSSDI